MPTYYDPIFRKLFEPRTIGAATLELFLGAASAFITDKQLLFVLTPSRAVSEQQYLSWFSGYDPDDDLPSTVTD